MADHFKEDLHNLMLIVTDVEDNVMRMQEQYLDRYEITDPARQQIENLRNYLLKILISLQEPDKLEDNVIPLRPGEEEA